MTLEEDNAKAAAAALAAKAAGAGKNGNGEGEGEGAGGTSEKTFTNAEVEKLVKNRVHKLTSRIEEFEKLLPPKTPPAKKSDGTDPIADLKAEIAELKADRDSAKADAAAAKLDKLKIKMAKGKLPVWFDPTLLRGKDEEEIGASIEAILADKKAEEDGIVSAAKKKGFGGPTPKGGGKQPTGDEIMNARLLARVGRSSER